jgi:ribosomal subunit interface protein
VDVIVSSPGVELPPAVKAAATEKVQKLVRYLDGMDRAEVLFRAEKNPRIAEKEICEITLSGGGHTVRARVHALDQFSAVDLAVEKASLQLQKLKTRLVDRNQGRTNGKASRPAPFPETAGEPDPTSLPTAGEGVGVSMETLVVEPGAEPKVVKMKRFRMKPMPVDEAIFQMGLMDHGFFFFVHEETGEPAVVYRRQDGNVGLIEADR